MRNLVNVAAGNRDELLHRAAPRGRRGVDVAQVDGERIRVVLHDAAGEPGHERVDLLRVVLSDGGVSLGVGFFLFELSTVRRRVSLGVPVPSSVLVPSSAPALLLGEQHGRHGGAEVGEILVEDLLLLVVPQRAPVPGTHVHAPLQLNLAPILLPFLLDVLRKLRVSFAKVLGEGRHVLVKEIARALRVGVRLRVRRRQLPRSLQTPRVASLNLAQTPMGVDERVARPRVKTREARAKRRLLLGLEPVRRRASLGVASLFRRRF